MKQFQVYRSAAMDDDSVVVLNFGTVPDEALDSAVQEAYEMALAPAVGEGGSLEEVYEQYPQLCGFEPWVWKASGGWQPRGLNREWLALGQKLAAKAELMESLRSFIDTYHRYISPDEIRLVMEQALSDAANARASKP